MIVTETPFLIGLRDLCDLLRNFGKSFLPDEARIMRVSNFCENDSSFPRFTGATLEGDQLGGTGQSRSRGSDAPRTPNAERLPFRTPCVPIPVPRFA